MVQSPAMLLPPARAASSGAPAWFVRGALGVTALGLLLRLAAIRHGTVISRDGITYLDLAQAMLRGDGEALARAYYPPGFPAVVAAGVAALGPSETSAAVASACASALVVPAIVLLVARLQGRVTGLLAGLVAAALPELVTIGAEVLSDGTYLALLAWTLLLLARLLERGGPAAGLGTAVVGGLAYLTRPEALVVLGGGVVGLLLLPRPDDRRAPARRLTDVAWSLAPAVLVVLPYLLVIREHAALGGPEGAGFKLTLKQNMPAILASIDPSRVASNMVRLGGRVAEVLAPTAPFLAFAWLAVTPGPAAGAATRRFARLVGLVGGLLLLAFAIVRADPRFGLQLSLLLVPLAGLALARCTRWAGSVGVPRWGPALLFVLISLPIALRERHESKSTYPALGLELAGEGVRRVLAADARAGFYLGAACVRLPPEAEDDPQAIVRLAGEQGVDAVVLIARTPAQEATSRRVSDLLEQAPWEVERAGGETLHVFWVRGGK